MAFSFRCAGFNSRAIGGLIYLNFTFIAVIIAIGEFEENSQTGIFLK